MKRLILPCFLFFVSGCAGAVTADANEEMAVAAPPVAEFDPASQIIPFPNNLVLDPTTHRVNIPPQPCESTSAAAVRGQLNQLDGFGTLRPAISATFSQEVDPASLVEHVFLVRIAGPGLLAPEVIPIDTALQTSLRFGTDCAAPLHVANVTLVPRSPLRQKSTYAALLVRGIKTQTGAEFQPSATWALVRQTVEPVELATSGSSTIVTYNATPFDPTNEADFATIQGLDLLWKAHNVTPPVLPAFDALLPSLASGASGRADMLLAWSFNTQTISDPFTPSVDGSPAAQLTSATAPDAPTMAAAPVAGPGGIPVEFFFAIAVPGTPCAALRCSAIGSVYLGVPGSSPDSFFMSPAISREDFAIPTRRRRPPLGAIPSSRPRPATRRSRSLP